MLRPLFLFGIVSISGIARERVCLPLDWQHINLGEQTLSYETIKADPTSTYLLYTSHDTSDLILYNTETKEKIPLLEDLDVDDTIFRRYVYGFSPQGPSAWAIRQDGRLKTRNLSTGEVTIDRFLALDGHNSSILAPWDDLTVFLLLSVPKEDVQQAREIDQRGDEEEIHDYLEFYRENSLILTQVDTETLRFYRGKFSLNELDPSQNCFGLSKKLRSLLKVRNDGSLYAIPLTEGKGPWKRTPVELFGPIEGFGQTVFSSNRTIFGENWKLPQIVISEMTAILF